MSFEYATQITAYDAGTIVDVYYLFASTQPREAQQAPVYQVQTMQPVNTEVLVIHRDDAGNVLNMERRLMAPGSQETFYAMTLDGY